MKQYIHESFYPYINRDIKADAFDIMDYYSCNRHNFDGLCFTEQFRKLYDECQFLGWDEDRLARAIDTCLTLEQQRMSSYSQGNHHIEDYYPSNVKSWTEYMK